jgi:hypothetical protein
MLTYADVTYAASQCVSLQAVVLLFTGVSNSLYRLVGLFKCVSGSLKEAVGETQQQRLPAAAALVPL